MSSSKTRHTPEKRYLWTLASAFRDVPDKRIRFYRELGIQDSPEDQNTVIDLLKQTYYAIANPVPPEGRVTMLKSNPRRVELRDRIQAQLHLMPAAVQSYTSEITNAVSVLYTLFTIVHLEFNDLLSQGQLLESESQKQPQPKEETQPKKETRPKETRPKETQPKTETQPEKVTRPKQPRAQQQPEPEQTLPVTATEPGTQAPPSNRKREREDEEDGEDDVPDAKRRKSTQSERLPYASPTEIKYPPVRNLTWSVPDESD